MITQSFVNTMKESNDIRLMESLSPVSKKMMAKTMFEVRMKEMNERLGRPTAEVVTPRGHDVSSNLTEEPPSGSSHRSSGNGS